MGLYDYQPVNYNLAGLGTPSSNNSLSSLGQSWGSPPVDYSLGGTGKIPGFGGMEGAVGTGSMADPTFLQGMTGYTDAAGMKSPGWGGAALGIAQGIGSAYSGMKQYGLAKEQLAFSKAAYEKNYAAQKSTTNASMEDRQRARVASNPGAYQSVGEYMGKHGIA